jgi:hypothetical protein
MTACERPPVAMNHLVMSWWSDTDTGPGGLMKMEYTRYQDPAVPQLAAIPPIESIPLRGSTAPTRLISTHTIQG